MTLAESKRRKRLRRAVRRDRVAALKLKSWPRQTSKWPAGYWRLAEKMIQRAERMEMTS